MFFQQIKSKDHDHTSSSSSRESRDPRKKEDSTKYPKDRSSSKSKPQSSSKSHSSRDQKTSVSDSENNKKKENVSNSKSSSSRDPKISSSKIKMNLSSLKEKDLFGSALQGMPTEPDADNKRKSKNISVTQKSNLKVSEKSVKKTVTFSENKVPASQNNSESKVSSTVSEHKVNSASRDHKTISASNEHKISSVSNDHKATTVSSETKKLKGHESKSVKTNDSQPPKPKQNNIKNLKSKVASDLLTDSKPSSETFKSKQGNRSRTHIRKRERSPEEVASATTGVNAGDSRKSPRLDETTHSKVKSPKITPDIGNKAVQEISQQLDSLGKYNVALPG